MEENPKKLPKRRKNKELFVVEFFEDFWSLNFGETGHSVAPVSLPLLYQKRRENY